MKEQLISFETAVLAKEKGFNWDSSHAYNEKNNLESALDFLGSTEFSTREIENAAFNDYICYLAPTQSLLQKFLREVHNIHIEVFLSATIPYNTYYYRVMEIGKYFSLSYTDDECSSYEQALEAGLINALKLIKLTN